MFGKIFSGVLSVCSVFAIASVAYAIAMMAVALFQ